MSQLGLARAFARTGNATEGVKTYEALISAWTGADSDLPALEQACSELDGLR
jgi:hypothetical protein